MAKNDENAKKSLFCQKSQKWQKMTHGVTFGPPKITIFKKWKNLPWKFRGKWQEWKKREKSASKMDQKPEDDPFLI